VIPEEQALEAQKAALAAAAAQTAQVPVSVVPAPQTSSLQATGGWDAVAQCESGGNWADNTGNGFYGGLQFDIQTWNNYEGFARADLAPKDVQIAKANEEYATRGTSPWPVCGARY
jgi:hypothetical protein